MLLLLMLLLLMLLLLMLLLLMLLLLPPPLALKPTHAASKSPSTTPRLRRWYLHP
jgi:hypothetical protein